MARISPVTEKHKAFTSKNCELLLYADVKNIQVYYIHILEI